MEALKTLFKQTPSDMNYFTQYTEVLQPAFYFYIDVISD